MAFSLLLTACGGSTGNDSSNQTGVNNKDSFHNGKNIAPKIKAEDFENSIFVTRGNERAAASFSVFKKDRTGVEYLSEFMNTTSSGNLLTWDVDDNALNVSYNGGNSFYTFKAEETQGNIISGRRSGGGQAPHKAFLFKALPLSIDKLKNKIIKYDLSHLTTETNPRGCTVRTLKFVGDNKAVFKEICNNESWAYIEVELQVRLAYGLNNIIELSFTGWDGAENKILMSLITGGLEDSGEFASVKSGEYKGVDIEKFTIVNKEAF